MKKGRAGNYLHKAALIYFAAAGLSLAATPLWVRLAAGFCGRELFIKLQTYALVLWLLSALYFLGLLVFRASLRDRFLGRMAGIKERDEREEYVVGRAAKAVCLVTLGGFLAMGIWGMSTVNWVYVQKGEQASSGIKTSFPFIGLALPVEWEKHTQMAWVRHNPGDPVEYKAVEEVDIMLYKDGYQILLTPPLHPKLSRIMFLCVVLQIGLFHLFAKLTERSMTAR